MEVSGRIGNPNYVAGGAGAKASIGTATINYGQGAPKGMEKIFSGLFVDANIGATLLSGECNAEGSLMGAKAKGTLGGTLVSAHIGGTFSAGMNSKTNSFDLNISGNAGLLFGIKLDVNLSVPLPK